jgi:hypothetical protein
MLLNTPREPGAGRERPAGIVVLDRFREPPDPQLRAFVWCRGHLNHPAPPAERLAAAQFPLLMVGLATNGGDGRP